MDLNEVLLVAAEEGNLLVLKTALEKGANINTESEVGRTALMIASEKGNMEVVKYLVEKGAKEKKVKEASNTQSKNKILKEETMDIKELLEGAANKLGCKLNNFGGQGKYFNMVVPLENNRSQVVISLMVEGNGYIRFLSFFGSAHILTLDTAIGLLEMNLSMTGVASAILDWDLGDGLGIVPRLVVVGEQLFITTDLDEVIDKIKTVAQQADSLEKIITSGGDIL